MAHLEELRGVVMKGAAALAVCTGAAFAFRGRIAEFIQAPLLAVDPSRAGNLQSLGVADSMTVSLKLAFYAGLICATPLLLWFVAGFVLPGLRGQEKRTLAWASVVGFGLFLAGSSFAFWGVLPATLDFFFRDAQGMQWNPTWTVGEYYSFTTQFVLSFGLAFELPVVVLALARCGIIGYDQMRKTRRYAVVLIFFLSAIITPTSDIFTLLLMGGPMMILYEACIWTVWWMEKRDKREKKKEQLAGETTSKEEPP